MKLIACLLFAFALQAEDAPKKADTSDGGRVLKADSCHYLIQGATEAQMRWLGQQKQCLKWESYAKYRDHLHAMYVYRSEIEVAFPPATRPWFMKRDLALVDAAIAEDRKFLAVFGVRW